MACTPLFLNEAPQITGKSFMLMVPARTAALISAGVIFSLSPPRYFSMRWSSTSARPSIILSRYSLTRSRMSAGMSAVLKVPPRFSVSSHT